MSKEKTGVEFLDDPNWKMREANGIMLQAEMEMTLEDFARKVFSFMEKTTESEQENFWSNRMSLHHRDNFGLMPGEKIPTEMCCLNLGNLIWGAVDYYFTEQRRHYNGFITDPDNPSKRKPGTEE